MSQRQNNAKSKSDQWNAAIAQSEEKFLESHLEFTQERIFATQALMNNDYLLQVAQNNPTSLRLAMYNVAAVGLTLNPNQGLAYLVPRRIKKDAAPCVVLDISYRGLITIGRETGAISWAKSELVYEKDEFVYRGPAEKPIHDCDPFDDDRGALKGGYCIAELPTGGVLVETMSKKEMDKIRDKSEAYKKGFGPWVEWEEQMRLKCPVKRGSKWWPQSPRLAAALKILNEENGEGISLENRGAQVVSLPHKTGRLNNPQNVKSMVDQLVNRAVLRGGFGACRELMESRIKDPVELSNALKQLDDAQANSSHSEIEIGPEAT